MLHLRARLLPLLRTTSLPTISSCTLLPRGLLFLSTTTTTAAPFSVEEYLVATCGLTAAQALKASKNLSTLKSASNPDAVLALLSGAGLSRPDIAAVVAADPQLLRARAGNISRRLASLRGRVGLSDPQIARFLLAGGALGLRSCDVAAKLEFWIPFLGSFHSVLRIVRRNSSFLKYSLEKVVKPNIALLGECGVRVCDIVTLSAPCPRLLVSNPERVKALIRRAERLSMPSTSYAFKNAIITVNCLSEITVAVRMEFLSRILGCSMDKVRQAVCKTPTILGLSEETLRRKIEFMTAEFGLEPEYIVEKPMLLRYSLERRMVPRHSVVKILQSMGLLKKCVAFSRLIICSEDDFIARYIDCHKDAVPGLADAYAAACSGKCLPEEHL